MSNQSRSESYRCHNAGQSEGRDCGGENSQCRVEKGADSDGEVVENFGKSSTGPFSGGQELL